MNGLKSKIRAFVPAPLISAYHFCLAYLGAFLFGFPSEKIIVVGVTGTNGKSSTAELIEAVFSQAGYKTALSNSIRVKVGPDVRPSTGRSMPGRFFIQRFLRGAVDANCSVAIVEMTSEGAKQFRHRAIELDALVFTNLAPEHIESHGSFEAYADAKFEIGKQLARSKKRPRSIVANVDDPASSRYLLLPVEVVAPFSLSANTPYGSSENGGFFTFDGVRIGTKLPGEFSLKNALAAATLGHAFKIRTNIIKQAVENVALIPGRTESIDAGQKFSVVIDYALTPDALEALYKTYGDRKKICVFGSAGGGRDVWKRPVLGKIAGTYCDSVILTNDIAYDEPPEKILLDIARGMQRAPEIIPDRRKAIRRSFELAQLTAPPERTVVLITGMGIDTEITDADGSKIAWNDAEVAREELEKLPAGNTSARR
jgi:UDP-N-acetylmuramoyl-L-alanyl-D-glutamate--2,6-diaminopimelate ligase